LHARLRIFTHSGSCNLLYALFIFKQVNLFVVARVCSLYRMQLYVFVCFSLAILKRLSQKSPLVDWHKLTYLVLTCRKTPINQSILNAAARLIYRSSKFDHVTPLLHDLHRLRSRDRITFRLAVLAYRCENGLAPQYFADDLHRVVEVESRRLRH